DFLRPLRTTGSRRVPLAVTTQEEGTSPLETGGWISCRNRLTSWRTKCSRHETAERWLPRRHNEQEPERDTRSDHLLFVSGLRGARLWLQRSPAEAGDGQRRGIDRREAVDNRDHTVCSQ